MLTYVQEAAATMSKTRESFMSAVRRSGVVSVSWSMRLISRRIEEATFMSISYCRMYRMFKSAVLLDASLPLSQIFLEHYQSFRASTSRTYKLCNLVGDEMR